MIERDAVDVSVAKQPAVAGCCRAHAIDVVTDGLAGALDGRDLAEPASIGEVAADTLDAGELRGIRVRDRRSYAPVGVPPFLLQAIAAIARHAVKRLADAPFPDLFRSLGHRVLPPADMASAPQAASLALRLDRGRSPPHSMGT